MTAMKRKLAENPARSSRHCKPSRFVPALEQLEDRVVLSNVPLGANVNGVVDWDLSNTFVDAMKQARQWTSIASGNKTPATVDTNGWPTQDFETIVQTGGVNLGHVYDGTYHLTFTGKANVSTAWTPNASITNLVYDSLTNITTANVNLNVPDSTSGWYFVLDFTNTSGVKDIKLIRPGYDANTTQVFTNQFLNLLKPFSAVRFMDWAGGNGDSSVNWSDRVQVTDARQSVHGVAWEYAIQLANTLHEDMWVNVPVNATDDYVNQMATLIKNNLDPSLHVYVEYSNEVWNNSFSQYQDNLNAAKAEVAAGHSVLNADGDTSASDWAFRRVAERLKRISDIFGGVFGAGSINTRVRPVLSGQVGWSYVTETQLDFANNTYGNPSQYFYAIAGAPYFNLNGQDGNTNLTEAQVLAALSANIDADIASFKQYKALATYYGLQDFSYEGGPDTFGPNNVAAKKAASLDLRTDALGMTNLVQKYLNGWYANGGGLFMWFTGGAGTFDSPYGTYSLTNDPTNLNVPKIVGLNKELSAAAPALAAGAAVPGDVAASLPAIAHSWTVTNPSVQPPVAGDYYEYLLNAPSAGAYTLQINIAAANAGSTLAVSINDALVQNLSVPATGSLANFVFTSPLTLQLNSGLNTLRLQALSNQAYEFKTLRFAESPPAAPAGLTATPASGSIALAWSAPTGAVSYSLYRGTSAGGEGATPYKTGIAGASYTDTAVTAGVTYYYQVVAVNPGGSSARSSEVSAKIQGPAALPAPWKDGDIGSPSLAGSASFANNTYTVAGSGADIWATGDSFHFAYQSLTGAGTIIARVAGEQNTNSWAKAGVMIRETTGAGSTFAMMAITPGNGAAFQWRSGTNSGAAWTGASVAGSAPYWVKLVRSGTTFTGYASSDGTTWTKAGSISLSMAANVSIGLAVTSHNNGVLNTSTFDNVAITTATPDPTPTPTSGLAINAGGGASGNFLADSFASGGTAYANSDVINTSKAINPAPQSVYDSARYGNFTYTIPNLTPGGSYTLRLHFAEIYWTTAGARLFNVAINGALALTNFDIFASAGGKDFGVVKQFATTADSNGRITIQFTSVKDNAMFSGLEIIPA